MKTITILISPNGDTKIEAHGFVGGECRLATQKLRTALGQDSSEQLKPEFSHVSQMAAPESCSASRLG